MHKGISLSLGAYSRLLALKGGSPKPAFLKAQSHKLLVFESQYTFDVCAYLYECLELEAVAIGLCFSRFGALELKATL